jgi:hypothetical protein
MRRQQREANRCLGIFRDAHFVNAKTRGGSAKLGAGKLAKKGRRVKQQSITGRWVRLHKANDPLIDVVDQIPRRVALLARPRTTARIAAHNA